MTQTDQPDLSIIIPTLNESANLPACLAAIPDSPGVEVILSDGGSTDGTLAIAEQASLKIVHSAAGRAIQMNTGARVAKGRTLLFLHADTLLPENAVGAITESIQRGFSMGCFERKFQSGSFLLALTSRLAGWRARTTFLTYGDQAQFFCRSLFESLGGFRHLRRFEDMDLAKRAKRHGRWTVITTPILTDARRFGHNPTFRIIKDAILTSLWLLGAIKQ